MRKQSFPRRIWNLVRKNRDIATQETLKRAEQPIANTSKAAQSAPCLTHIPAWAELRDATCKLRMGTFKCGTNAGEQALPKRTSAEDTRPKQREFPLSVASSLGQTLSQTQGMDMIILELLASPEHQAEGLLVPLALPHQPPPRTSHPGVASGMGPEGGRLAHVPACVWGLAPALSHLSSCVLERRMCTIPRTNTRTGLLGGKAAREKK